MLFALVVRLLVRRQEPDLPRVLKYGLTGHSSGTCEEAEVIGWWKKQRLDDGVRRRLLFALARAEEELLETHVQNALDVVDAVGDSLTVGRALELYLEALEPEEPRATIIAKRVLARLEREDAERAKRRKRRRRAEDEA